VLLVFKTNSAPYKEDPPSTLEIKALISV